MTNYGYMRVSTLKQQLHGTSLEEQLQALTAAGAEIFYKDTYTGTTTDRPAFNELCAVVQPGDTIIVTKLDRYARTVIEGLQITQQFLDRGITVHLLDMGIIDSSLTGQMLLTIMLAFAEFERNKIYERTQQGKAIARTKPGYKDGRPPKYNTKQLAHALELLETHSYRQVTEMTGISDSTLYRAKRAAQNSKEVSS